LCISNAIIIKNNTFAIHFPVYLMQNRYGHKALNEWDGNSISLDAAGGTAILAPQVGAGRKNQDNSFTGVFMGSVKNYDSGITEDGLFAYESGYRTFFLDAITGKTSIGKQGAGQIILDPSNN
jgi:hypothetical protein